MHFALKTKKAEPMLLFHIGSASVGGALFTPGTGKPKIIFSVSEPIAPDAEFDAGKFFKKTVRVLGKVAERVHAARITAPRRCFVVLASPWYASATRRISLKKNTPFVFTEKVADELIQKEVKLFAETHVAKYAGTSEAVRIIELKNIKTLLNGYDNPEPLYKKCKELEMSMFLSTSGESALGLIEQAIGRHFSFERIKFSSFAVASFTVARDTRPVAENFLLVDIGGEITEIFMVKKGILSGGISFPAGRNHFVRGIARHADTGIREAASLLSLYKSGHAALAVLDKLGPIMKKLGDEWLQKFQESLANISNDISVPAKVYVTAEGDEGGMFGEIIKSEQFSQYTLAESKFEITVLDAKALHELAEFGGELPPDPALTADAIYISRFLATI